MNKKLLCGIIFLILLILSGCNKKNTYVISQEDMQKSEERLDTIKDASETNDLSKCYNLEGRHKAICMSNIGINLSDSSICQEIQTLENNMGKDDDCFMHVAAQKKDINLCGNIKQIAKKNSCIRDIAFNLNDVSLCSMVEVTTTNDADYICYVEFAKKNNDVLLCDNIKKQSNKEFCIMETAVSSNDISLCNKIADLSIQSRCQGKFE